VERCDPIALRTGRHDEGTVLAAFDAPGRPTAALVLDLDERSQLGLDGWVILEGKA
jgi:hypothetical protein